MKRINLTTEDVLKDFERVLLEQGKLTIRIYREHGKYSTGKIRQLDTFNNLKKQLSIDNSINNYKVSKNDLVADVERVYSTTDKMTKDYYLANGQYSRKPIERHFGSWNNMLNELNLKTNCLINIPKTDLLDDLIRLFNEYDTLSATIVKYHGTYSVEVYQRRFGSFNKAVVEAGLNPNAVRGSDSKVAKSMIKKCSEILGEKPIKEHTFDWLINPETGKHLYIDAYFPEHNIAFEYDGPHHFIEVPFYGGKTNLVNIQRLDSLKNTLLFKNGVKYIRFPYDSPHSRGEIIKRLSELV